MDFKSFNELADNYNIVPVYEKITADMLTPVSAYLKIRHQHNFNFLFESVEGIGRLARYSFIGTNPNKIIIDNNGKLTITESDSSNQVDENLFDHLKQLSNKYKAAVVDELPDFTGGLIGYIGFESISQIEDVIEFDGVDELDLPDSLLGLFDSVIAFDHYKHQIILIQNVFVDKSKSLQIQFDEAKHKLKLLRENLQMPINYKSDFKISEGNEEYFDKEKFSKVVEKAKKNIFNGDVFQLVLSKRFSSAFTGDQFNVYRALRMINPSPYMYYIEHNDELSVIGTSPEDLLKVKNGKAAILPIAGTRRRGKTFEDDLNMEEDLKNDPKEIAEHVMLVDLARNDLGRVCDFDTVKVTEEMNVHRFSHVMHLVSRVEGKLKNEFDCIDAFRASFPAGTVSGAPKIRAIQLINEYEQLKRGIYAGAVGYIDFNGNMDMCIAIRTMFTKGKSIYWQAGAGIVADSKPELELKEIKNKSAALVKALEYAEVIDENIDN
ncbi:MAG: anthranilate synthase component I [Melioribacteraceae bacterium]|nr:anthranilate synthase component I [Melioribacteraceae bacterium]MCF8354203.1 anthranilate synthase component I [Melioribacteraceae bacterium]MCF8392849.1 anthranilate synthase component I [Melioribacteraceae bacterium]MCF8418665.1 anthranilate synthase component I [Melioribacteraceae bacterium]